MEKTPVYEVRCEHCQTSFAPGTKNCVHCGRRIGGGLIQILGSGGQAGGQGETLGAPAEEAEDSELQAAGRSPMWVLTALFLVGSAVLRACAER